MTSTIADIREHFVSSLRDGYFVVDKTGCKMIELCGASFLANERDYLRMRDSLLPQFSGQWVAVEQGKVIASGHDLRAVSDAALAQGGRPYIVRVGAEDQTVFRG